MKGFNKEDETSGNESDLKSLVRTPRKFETSLADKLDDLCHVCFRLHDKIHNRQTPANDPAMEFMWCYGCLTPVHKVCHGLETPHEKEVTDFGDEVTMFVCDRCRYLSTFNLPACVVCKQSNGLQKKTTNNKWVHPACALFSDDWVVYDFKTMDIRPDFEQNRPGKKSRAQRKKCEACKASDNVYPCSHCDLHTHLYCVLRNKTPFLLEDEETRAGWTLYIETEPVDSIWASFDPSDEKLKYDILALYLRCEKISSGAIDPELPPTEVMQEEEDPKEAAKPEKNNKKKSGSKKKKKTKTIKATKDKEKKDIEDKVVKEEVKVEAEEVIDPEAANNPLFIELYQKVQVKVNEMLAAREKSNNMRGGRTHFECPVHRSEDLLCICRKPYVEAIFMVRCDCCTNWFHEDCIGVKPDEAALVEHYICQGCRDWYAYKLSNLFPSQSNQLMDTEKDSNLIPNYTYKFYLNEYIELVLILEKKIESAAISTSELLEAARRVPINMQGVIAMSYRKAILKEATDIIISFFLGKKQDEFMIEPIFDSETKSIDDELMKKNIETVEKLRRINKLYVVNNIQGTKTQDLLEKKAANLEWLKSFAEIVSRKPTFEEVKELTERADKIHLLATESPERQYLETAIQSAHSFFKDQKKVLEDHVALVNGDNKKLEEDLERVPKDETLQAVEETFASSMAQVKELLQKRMKLADLEELISSGKKLEIDFPNDIAALEKEVERARSWLSLAQPRKYLEYVNYIQEMSSLVVFLPEMLDKLDKFEEVKRHQLRLYYFIKVIENTTAKKDKADKAEKKADSMVDESEENADLAPSQKIQLKDAKDLKTLLDEQNIDFGPEYQQLKDKIKHSENLQNKIHKQLENQLEPTQLKSLHRDAEKAAFTFPELEEIQHNMSLFHELTTISKKPVTLATLEQKRVEAKSLFKTEAGVLGDIEAKIEKGKNIQERAETLLSQDEFSKEDIFDKAQALLNELKTNKIDIPEKDTLQYLEKSYKWMEKFYNFWVKKQPAQPYDTMEIETIKPTSKGKEPFTAEYSCKVCLNTTVFENEFSKYSQDLSQIIKAGQNIEHRDVRIREVFYKYAHLLWIHEARFTLSKIVLAPEDLASLKENAELFSIDESEPIYSDFKATQIAYEKAMDNYLELNEKYEFDNLKELDEYEPLRIKAMEAKKMLQETKVRNQHALDTLERVLLWVEWYTKARLMKEMEQQSKRFVFSAVKNLLTLGDMVKIPKDNELYQLVVIRNDELSKIHEEYTKFKKTRSDLADFMKTVNQNTDPKARKRLTGEANKTKPHLKECKDLLDSIEKSRLDINPDEQEKMESDIAVCEEWWAEVQKFIQENQLDKNLNDSSAHFISEGLNSLRSQMMNLPFQIENADSFIFGYEWKFHALGFLNNIETSKGRKTIKDWTRLIKMTEEKEKTNPELRGSTLYNEVNEQIQIHTKLFARVASFRNSEEKLREMLKNTKEASSSKADSTPLLRKELSNIAELKRLDDDLADCKVEIPEEKKYIQDLLEKAKKVLEFYHRICVENLEKHIKSPLKDYTNLQESFKILPIAFANEERNLDSIIGKARSMQKSLEDSKRMFFKDGRLGVRYAQLAVEQYKGIPIIIKEAEQLLKDYQQSQEIIESISKTIEQQKIDQKMDYGEILILSKRVDEIPMDLGEQFDQLKYNLYSLKVDYIKNSAHSVNEDGSSQSKIDFANLKALLIEGYSLLVTKFAIDVLRENVKYVEDLALEVEAQLTTLYNIKDMNELESLQASYQGLVDIKEEIIVYKAYLTLDKNYHMNLESSVKNIFQNSDEQIINMMKAEKAYSGTGKEGSKEESNTRGKKDKKGSDANDKKGASKGSERDKRRQAGKPTDDDYEYDNVAAAASGEVPVDKDDPEWELKKKIKLDAGGQSVDKVTDKDKDKNAAAKTLIVQKPKKVTPEVRTDNQKKFAQAIKQNPNFGELTDEQGRKFAKDIEVNLFSEYHDNGTKYSAKSDDIRSFFQKLKKYKFLSKKVVGRQFGIEVINPLLKLRDIDLPAWEQKAEHNVKNSSKSDKDQGNKPQKPKSKPNPVTKAPGLDEIGLFLGENLSGQTPSRMQALITQQQPKDKEKEKKPLVNNIKEGGHSSEDEEKAKKKAKKSKMSDDLGYFSDEEEEREAQKSIAKESSKEPIKESVKELVKESSKELTKESSKEPVKERKMDDIMAEESASSGTGIKFKKEAILFDPDDDDDEEELPKITTKSTYDPFNVSLTMPIADEVDDQAMDIEEVDYPTGSMLQIFEGRFKNGAKKSKHMQVFNNIKLLTTEDCNLVRSFPKLPSEIKVEGRLSSTDTLKYLETLIKRSDKKTKMMRGWVVCTGSDQNALEKLADDLFMNNKFLGFKYNDYAAAYFFHPGETPADNVLQLEPKVRKTKEHPNIKPIFYFIIYERRSGSFVPNVNGEAIRPVLVEALEEPLPTEKMEPEVAQPKLKKKKPEPMGDYSPITSDEEEDKMSTEGGNDVDLGDFSNVNLDEIMNVYEEVANKGLFSNDKLESQTSQQSDKASYGKPLSQTETSTTDYRSMVARLKTMPRDEMFHTIQTLSEEDKNHVLEMLNTMAATEDDDSKLEENSMPVMSNTMIGQMINAPHVAPPPTVMGYNRTMSSPMFHPSRNFNQSASSMYPPMNPSYLGYDHLGANGPKGNAGQQQPHIPMSYSQQGQFQGGSKNQSQQNQMGAGGRYGNSQMGLNQNQGFNQKFMNHSNTGNFGNNNQKGGSNGNSKGM